MITMTMIGNVIKDDICIYYNIVAVGIATCRKSSIALSTYHIQSQTLLLLKEMMEYHTILGLVQNVGPAKPPEPQT